MVHDSRGSIQLRDQPEESREKPPMMRWFRRVFSKRRIASYLLGASTMGRSTPPVSIAVIASLI